MFFGRLCDSCSFSEQMGKHGVRPVEHVECLKLVVGRKGHDGWVDVRMCERNFDFVAIASHRQLLVQGAAGRVATVVLS